MTARPGPPATNAAPRLAAAEDEFSPAAVEQRIEAHAHYGAAIVYDMRDEPEPAAEELYQAALHDLSNESFILEASRRLMQLKQNDKAAILLGKATAQPNAPGVLFARLGLAYSLLGKNEQAIEANRMAIRKMPRSFAGYQNLGRIYLQAGQHAEGLKVLEQAAKQPGVDAAFLVDLSELYTAYARSGAAQSQVAKPQALEALNRAARLDPSNPLVLQKLADGFTVLGESDKAAEVYGKLLKRFPNLPGLREKLAEIYLRQENHEKAAEQLEAIIRNTPTNPQAYYFLGSIAFEQKKMKEAAGHFRKALLLDPKFEAAYYELALTQVNLNEGREALKTLDDARDKFRQSFVGEFFAGLAYARLKEYSNALGHFVAAEVIARATDTNRLTHVLYFQLGAAYERNKQYEEAEANFKKCLALSPNFSEAMNYLGYMWAERGVNLAQARELIEKAVKLEPKNAAFLDSLAWVLFKLDQPKEALTFLLQALEHIEEPDPTLYDHLGDIYAALHQPDKAAEAWRKALAIEPNQEIQKKLTPASTSGNPPR